MSNVNFEPISKVMEITGMTQEGLKNYLGISRQTVVNYMTNTNQIPNNIIRKLMKLSGLSYEELMGEIEIAEGVFFEKSANAFQNLTINKLDSVKGIIDFVTNMTLQGDQTIISEHKAVLQTEFSQLKKEIDKKRKKPLIGLVGTDNAGLNVIRQQMLGELAEGLGKDLEIAVPLVIHSVKEEPAVNAYLLNSIKPNEPKSGDISSIVSLVKDERQLEDGVKYEVHYYGKAEMLEGFDMVLFSTERLPDYKNVLDGLIFATRLSGKEMLGDMEISGIGEMLKEESVKWENFFLVTTWADVYDDNNENMFKDLASRIVNIFPDEYISSYGNRARVESLVRDRIFKLDFYNINSTYELYSAIDEAISRRIELQKSLIMQYLQMRCEEIILSYEEKRNNILNSQLITKDTRNFKTDIHKVEVSRKMLEDSMNFHKENARKKFMTEYAKLIEQKELLKRLETKNIKNRQTSQMEFISYIIMQLTEKVKIIINDEIEQCFDECGFNGDAIDVNDEKNRKIMNELRGQINNLLQLEPYIASNMQMFSNFATTSAMQSLGVASLGTTALVSSSALSTSLLTTCVPAIAGVLIASGIIGIIAGKWQDRFVSNLIKAFKESKIETRYLEVIDSQWSDLNDVAGKIVDKIEEGKNAENMARDVELDSETANSLAMLYKATGDVYRTLEPSNG